MQQQLHLSSLLLSYDAVLHESALFPLYMMELSPVVLCDSYRVDGGQLPAP